MEFFEGEAFFKGTCRTRIFWKSSGVNAILFNLSSLGQKEKVHPQLWGVGGGGAMKIK